MTYGWIAMCTGFQPTQVCQRDCNLSVWEYGRQKCACRGTERREIEITLAHATKARHVSSSVFPLFFSVLTCNFNLMSGMGRDVKGKIHAQWMRWGIPTPMLPGYGISLGNFQLLHWAWVLTINHRFCIINEIQDFGLIFCIFHGKKMRHTRVNHTHPP